VKQGTKKTLFSESNVKQGTKKTLFSESNVKQGTKKTSLSNVTHTTKETSFPDSESDSIYHIFF